MPDALSRPVFLDTTVVSNFASSQSVDTLDNILDSVAIVPAVRDELERGVDHGHEYLERAVTTIKTEWDLVDSSTNVAGYSNVHDRLDRGEAQALLGAISSDGTLATDDLAARRLAADEQIDVTGSVGVLAVGISRGSVTVETADEWLDTWRKKRGYYAPVESVLDVLE